MGRTHARENVASAIRLRGHVVGASRSRAPAWCSSPNPATPNPRAAHASLKQAELALEPRQPSGPAFYSPFNYSGFGAQVNSRFPSTSGGRFPRSMRSWELEAISRAKDVTPGPGMYNPRNSSLGEQREGPVQTGPRHSFPMADRSVGQKVHLSKEHTRELLLTCSPSPVTYAVPSSGLGEQIQSVKPSRPAYTFGHSERFYDRVIGAARRAACGPMCHCDLIRRARRVCSLRARVRRGPTLWPRRSDTPLPIPSRAPSAVRSRA